MSDDRRWNPDKVRVDVSRDLRAIVELFGDLPEHAESEGDPTGEAVMLLGNVGNVEAFGYRIDAAKDTSHAADQVELDALFVLATWEDAIREERDQPTDLRATVPRAADYLRESLTWALSNDEYGNLTFLGIDQMQTDLAKVRSHLENVLKAGDRSDRGAPCLQCGTALVKDWGDCDEECAREVVKARAEDREPEHKHDRWRCPKSECPVRYVDGDELALAIKNTARMHAEWLTATDMAVEYRINVGTLQSWATRKKVRKRRDFDSGRMTYNVAEAIALRDGAEDERMGA